MAVTGKRTWYQVQNSLFEVGKHPTTATDGWALLLAAHDGQTLIVRSLLDAGADVHAGNEHALEAAVLNGHAETARVLLEAGANPRDESSPVAAWRLRITVESMATP